MEPSEGGGKGTGEQNEIGWAGGKGTWDLAYQKFANSMFVPLGLKLSKQNFPNHDSSFFGNVNSLFLSSKTVFNFPRLVFVCVLKNIYLICKLCINSLNIRYYLFTVKSLNIIS